MLRLLKECSSLNDLLDILTIFNFSNMIDVYKQHVGFFASLECEKVLIYSDLARRI